MADNDAAQGHGRAALFQDCVFAVVPSRLLGDALIATVEFPTLHVLLLHPLDADHSLIQISESATRQGAAIVELDNKGRIPVAEVTHIISNTIDFDDFAQAGELLVPVVTSDWISTCLSRNRLVQVRSHSPDPRMIFSKVVLTCADIPVCDKESIIGATLAMGGTESKDLTRATTHVCALDFDHPKCKEAKARLPKCKIVLPHWFDDCFKLSKKIDEGPYLLPNPEILEMSPTAAIPVPSSQHLEGAVETRPRRILERQYESARVPLTIFSNKAVMLSDDIGVTERFREHVADLIQSGGGSLVSDVDECDAFVCQYRDGDGYVRAAQTGKSVGNLAWLCYLITYNQWVPPMNRLLHYPVPRNGIPGFKGLKIALSNFAGDSRLYLENLIEACGAEFTRTLKPENTHLITARNNGEKCMAASEWNVEIINHLWLEESYAKCEYQRISVTRYTTFPKRTNLSEVVGQTLFDEKTLRETYYPGSVDDEVINGNSIVRGSTPKKTKGAKSAGGRRAVAEIDVHRDEDELVEHNARSSSLPTPPAVSKTFATPARGRHVRTGKENDGASVMSSGSRSAKDKALSKLHGLAPDIALYEKEKKRATKDGNGPWGGKRAADQYERDQEAAKDASPAHDDTDDDQKQRPAKKVKVGPAPAEMRILLTGFSRWVDDSRKEEIERVWCPVFSLCGCC
jgi:hypothetical protein